VIQLVTPNPNIPCKPGWCLQYVRQTFGAPAVEPTATAGWANAKYRHEDWNFPGGCWVPVWFSLANEPAGHVALLAPDGSVYSTSDDSTTPHHHPNMADLIRYYWRNPLTYLGWSEDISGVRVVRDISIQTQSETITPVQEDDMATVPQDEWEWAKQVLTALSDNAATKKDLAGVPQAVVTAQVPYKDPVTGQDTGQTTSLATMAGYADFQASATRALVLQGPAGIASQINAAGLAQAVRDELVKLIGGAK